MRRLNLMVNGRLNYGITWGNPMANGGMDVGNEVIIDLQLEAMKLTSKPGEE
ncbi:MAG TPA: hypothetical protein VLB68_21495 [Pyrinomonadaceae bacterium]|nr:hypothetical protein [Pyrinomonadaceae bacterium]